MTIEEFLEEFKKTSFEWTLEDRGQVIGARSVMGSLYASKRCPLTAVGEQIMGRYRPISSYFEVAEEMGLSRQDAVSISIAADKDVGHDPELRKQLLEIVGLEEKITVEPAI